MAAHRYWRLTGFAVNGSGALELSEARLYAAGVAVDASATITCSFAPLSGTLTELMDGLATGVVSWSFAAHSSSGFALVWDLGGTGAAGVNALRLGSGNSAATWPMDLALQCSDDAISWVGVRSVVSAQYPGSLTLTDEPAAAAAADPFFENVSLLLHGDGAGGSSVFIDSGPSGKSIAVSGGAVVSTAQSIFGGASMYFGTPGARAVLPNQSDSRFAVGDFTVEMWVLPINASSGDFQCLIAQRTISGVGWGIYIGRVGGLLFQTSAGSPDYTLTSEGQIVSGVWQHVALTRESGAVRLFVDGVVKASSTPTTEATTSEVMSIGFQEVGSAYPFAGYIDELRITNGVARYTAAFTPPDASFAAAILEILPAERPLPRRWRAPAASSASVAGAALPNVGAAFGLPRTAAFCDVYNGGWGVITGTVKEKNTPANTPLRRRVLLIDEASRITIGETWSDAATGNYEFRGVKEGVKYTVLSYDHLHNYRAVIADNLTLANGGVELMP